MITETVLYIVTFRTLFSSVRTELSVRAPLGAHKESASPVWIVKPAIHAHAQDNEKPLNKKK